MDRAIIAILRGVTPDDILPIAREILDAGVTKIEVPLNSPDAVESIRKLVEAHGAEALIGAGTVLSVADVEAVHAVGGKLIVSPNCDPEVIARTAELGMESWPGIFTPT